MFGYLDFLFLSYSGRIGRTTYWLSYLVLGIVELVGFWLLLQLSHGTLEQLALLDGETRNVSPAMLQDLMVHIGLPMLIVSLLFLYPTYAIATKRWHDRDKSGWWSLIAFVPIIGGLWMFIELGFLGPSDPVNRYGTREQPAA